MLSITLLVSALAASVSAQSYNTTYVTGLANFLTSMGLTELVAAVTNASSTPSGMMLLNNINGTSKTLLAPNNAAFAGYAATYPNATSTNTTNLGDRLSYHLLSGNFTASSFARSPNKTIARTYFDDPQYVYLEGNKTQALAISVIPDSINGTTTPTVHILNQNSNVTVLNTTQYGGLTIHVIDAVIDTPGTVAAAFNTWNLTALPTVLDSLNYTTPLILAHGITVFAPTDTAFAAVASTLASLNTSEAASILSNHIINGTSAYTPLFGNGGKFTSAAGEAFTYTQNATGQYITSGSTTATILTSDIILANGVMHIIDTVLTNNATNPSAASSAYSAAQSSATVGGTSVQAGGVDATSTGTGAASATTSSKKSAAVRLVGDNLAVQMVALCAGALAGAALLI